MKNAPPQQQPGRHLPLILMMIALSFLLWRPPQPPPESESAAPTQKIADAAIAPAEAARLIAAGQPPYVADLQLNEPLWRDLQPQQQIAAIRQKLESDKHSPLVPAWHLTIAWLYEQKLPGETLQAAKEYETLTRYMNPKKGDQVSEYPWAAQAKLRAGELYAALARSENEPKYLKRARREYDSVTSLLQRYEPDPFKIYERQGDRWVEPVGPDGRPDAYGFVLKLVDEIARDSTMYKVLETMVRVTGGHHGWNMVLVLVLLAVLLKLVMHPLSRKSYRSMAEMQKLQPHIQELQKKYKDKPEQLNREMMQLYSQHGVNPLGGCLPMLLQIPVFIAVYQGIRAYTYQFHHVTFLWIESLADTDVALLLVYGLSMFVTQWLTMKRQPTPTDPNQAMTQKMMAWLMPIMFTYMMYLWKLPSAFYLYWLAFNVVSTIEQIIIHGPKPAEAPAPAPTLTELRDTAAKGKPRAGRASSGKKKGRRRGGKGR